MSVEKPNFSNLVKENIPFTVLPNIVLQNLFNAEALGMWCYLVSLPETWSVSRKQLMNHFNIGREKLDRILRFLIEKHLLEYLWIKNENGTIKQVTLVVKNGDDFIKLINNQRHDTTTLKSRIVDSSTTLKSHLVDYPLSGETAPIKEIKSIKENEKQREERSLFKPDSKNQDLAQRLGVDIQAELRSFAEKHRGQKNQAEFEIWLKHAKDYQDKKKSYTRNEPRSTVQEYGPGHPHWEARQRLGLTMKRDVYN